MKKLALLLGLVSVLSAMVGRSVWADDCSLSVEAGDTLAYNLTTMSAPASCGLLACRNRTPSLNSFAAFA